ncbi:protein of unknown function [Ralstonia solanacearum CMR15]|nr:protein of unknown function [Ralstonia solanacearum CMR15]
MSDQNTFYFMDWKGLTNEVMTSLYLYGKLTPPSDLNDRVKNANRGTVTVNIDLASFMSEGAPGSYSNISQIKFVKTLFGEGEESLAQWMAKFGITDDHPWTVRDLKKQIAKKMLNGKPWPIGDSFSDVLQQYKLDPGSPEYGRRTYIYNTEKFDLSDDTIVNFNTSKPNAAPVLENVSLIPRDEDFDFVGGGGVLTFLGNDGYLKPNIDPQNIGKTVNIVYSNISGIPAPVVGVYNVDNYIHDIGDVARLPATDSSVALSVLSAMKDVVGDLIAEKIVEYVRDGRRIIYGTTGNDKIAVQSQLVAPQASDILVGGAGDDWLIGGAGDDILMDGSGNDTLEGGFGFDQYVMSSSGGRDVIYDTDGQGSISIGGKVYGADTTLVDGQRFTWIDNGDGGRNIILKRGL